MMSALWLLIETVGSLLATACVLRAVAWSQSLSARNPLMQFVIAITDWIVKPLRRVVPASRKVDWASIAAALILSLVLAFFYSVLLLARSPMFGGVFFIALFWLCKWSVYLLIGLLLVQAVLSWVNPYSPLAAPAYQLTRSLLDPIRRILPAISGIDLSPLVAILLLQAALIFL